MVDKDGSWKRGVFAHRENFFCQPIYRMHADKTFRFLCKAEIDKLCTTGCQWVNNGCYLRLSSDFDSSLQNAYM